MAGHDIPILRYTNKPKEDPIWNEIFGQTFHSDYVKNVFLRPNGEPVNLYNLYRGQTCYLICRGPSLGSYLEDKETYNLLMNDKIVKYCINDSPDCIDYNCQLYSCTDKPIKFNKNIWKNPNIMKIVSKNRVMSTNNMANQRMQIAYNEGKNQVHISTCPNLFALYTYIIDSKDVDNIDFVHSYFSSPAVLYGYHNGIKSTFLVALKVAMLLGFDKIVLVGVDFNMKNENPYYGKDNKSYPKFHIQHNKKLYDTTAPLISNICRYLDEGKGAYECKIVSAKKINAISNISEINLKEMLKKDIDEYK